MSKDQPDGIGSLPNLLIRASAGTGKTFRLSNRFLELLRIPTPGERILATTFTRKAAGEILERVILRLAEAAGDKEKLAELGEFTGGGPFGRTSCLALLEAAMVQLHRLRISTLDSFFSQIARSFSLELNLPPGWQIVDDLADDRLRSQAVEAVLAQGDLAKLRTLMNLLNKGAAARSVSQLVRDTVKSYYDLFQDTDAEAWRKLRRPKPLSESELVAAMDDLAGLPIEDRTLSKARDEDQGRAARGDWEAFVKTGLAAKIAAGEDRYKLKPIPPHVPPVYERLIGHARAELLGLVAMQNEATYDLLAMYDAEYQRLKHSRRALRFSDITRRLSSFDGLQNADSLSFRMDAQIDHLLLDEFQDTSPRQWQVLRPLAERSCHGQGTSFFCVGDVKQAIYAWRGGVAEIFDAIDSQLPGLEPLHLNKSFRSSPVIIDTVNRVFQDTMNRHTNLDRAARAVRRWVSSFEPHQTAKTDLAGYAELVTSPRADKANDQKDVTLQYAAGMVARLVQDAPGRSVGLLVRTNETVGRLIYHLRQNGVVASEEGGNPLTDSAAVSTVLSLLRLADHPGDSVARFHVANSPLAAVVDFTDHRDDTAARRLAAQVRRRLLECGYGPAVGEWASKLAAACTPRELSRVRQLIEMAYNYQDHTTLRTDDFVRWIRETKVSDPIPADVRVMTVHQAKGLEFDIVVLPELDGDIIGSADGFVVDRPDVTAPARRVCRYAAKEIQRLMPESFQRMFDDAVDHSVTESLCLLYVALTRAIHALHIVIPPAVLTNKGKEGKFPRTYGGLVRASLAGTEPVEPETTLFAMGTPDWFRSVDEPPQPTTVASADKEPVRVQLAPLSGNRRRGLERIAPSSLEGGRRVRWDDLFTGDRAESRLRGRLIHAWFEQVTWLDHGPPAEADLREAAKEILTGSHATIDVDHELPAFFTMLKLPAVNELLSEKRYQRLSKLGFSLKIARQLSQRSLTPAVQAERRFAVRDGNRLLSGVIDRLVLLEDDDQAVVAEIIDFKTDAIQVDDDQRLRQRTAFYEPQLKTYRRAVSQITGIAPTRILTTLVFTDPGLVVPLETGEETKQLRLW